MDERKAELAMAYGVHEDLRSTLLMSYANDDVID